MFDFDFSDELKQELEVLSKKDKPLLEALKSKVREIISRDSETIDFYKNLRHSLSDFKRVHIGSFILTFRVFKNQNYIRFETFEHHDQAYKK